MIIFHDFQFYERGLRMTFVLVEFRVAHRNFLLVYRGYVLYAWRKPFTVTKCARASDSHRIGECGNSIILFHCPVDNSHPLEESRFVARHVAKLSKAIPPRTSVRGSIDACPWIGATHTANTFVLCASVFRYIGSDACRRHRRAFRPGAMRVGTSVRIRLFFVIFFLYAPFLTRSIYTIYAFWLF